MKNLRDAILAVLKSADKEWQLGDGIVVNKNALYVLQEEFNIHFVEPEDTQVTIIER